MHAAFANGIELALLSLLSVPLPPRVYPTACKSVMTLPELSAAFPNVCVRARARAPFAGFRATIANSTCRVIKRFSCSSKACDSLIATSNYLVTVRCRFCALSRDRDSETCQRTTTTVDATHVFHPLFHSPQLRPLHVTFSYEYAPARDSVQRRRVIPRTGTAPLYY